MRRLFVILLCMVSFCAFGAQSETLNIPKDKVGTHVLFGSRIVHVNRSHGKVFTDGQRNHHPLLMEICNNSDSAIVLRPVRYRNRQGMRMMRHGKAPKSAVLRIVSQDEKSFTVDLSEYFSTYPELVSAIPPKMLKGRASHYKITATRECDDYLQVTGNYSYESGWVVTANCYIIYLKSKPLPWRSVDPEKAGYTYAEYKNDEGQKMGVSLRWDLSNGKKIDFYVDRKFPEEWFPYIKAGIEDWNKAFEAIGMHDVISVSPEPRDGSLDRFSPLVNMVRYIDVDEPNAKGDVLFDPRSGEILSADILWWRGVLGLLCDWRYLQTGAADPAARLSEYPMEMLGPMIRHAVCHEMGHVLGLSHNMGASWAYPSDSLLSPTFTAQYGTAASVMDYARYNHLATAADLAAGVNLMPPHLGPYDYYAIALGYLPEGEAKPGKYCYFAPFISAAISPDPSAQAETLGNDLLRSSGAGLRNCCQLLTLDGLDEHRLKFIRKQYYRYISLALSNIGGKVADKPVKRWLRNKTLNFVYQSLADAPEQIRNRREEQKILKELTGNFLPVRVEETCGKWALRQYNRKIRRLNRKYPELQEEHNQ